MWCAPASTITSIGLRRWSRDIERSRPDVLARPRLASESSGGYQFGLAASHKRQFRQQRPCEIEHLVRAAASAQLPLGQQHARELPGLRVDADGGGDNAVLPRDLAVARDLVGKGRGQVGVISDVLLLLVEQARRPSAALVRIEHDARLDLRPAKAVGDRPGTAAGQEIAKAFVPAPEIERRIFVLDGAEAAALAQQ